MNALVLQVFVSLVLVVSSLVLWLFTHRARDLDHTDRLSLLPLEDELTTPPRARRSPHPPIKEQVDASQ